MITIMDDTKKLLWVDTLDEAYMYNIETTRDVGAPSDILKGIKESGLENLKIAIPIVPRDYKTTDYNIYYQGRYYPTILESIIRSSRFSVEEIDSYLYNCYDVYYKGKYYPTALESLIKESGFDKEETDFYLYHRNITKGIASEDIEFNDKEIEEKFKAIARVLEDPSLNPFTKEQCYTFSYNLRTGGKVPRL